MRAGLLVCAAPVALVLAALCGCSRGKVGQGPIAGPAVPPASIESQAASVPRTVVTLSPAVTEIVFALGQGTKVVGVSDFVTYPEEAKELPPLGGYINPNLEVLRALSPDLVIFQGISDEVQDACKSMGQESLSVKLDTIEDVWHAIGAIADRLGCKVEGDRLASDLKAELDAVRAAVAGEPPVRVFICAGREPGTVGHAMTCAKGTFLDQLVAVAGGDNVFHDTRGLYPTPSLEQVVKAAPEAIVDLQPGADATKAAECAKDWAQLGALPAVTNGRVLVVTDEYLLTPGPRLTQSARRLARLLHPEAKIYER
jgi:iron complex transport system substrate-binding protein